MTATELSLFSLSSDLLGDLIEAKKSGNVDRVIELEQERSRIAAQLKAIAMANPPVLSVRKTWGGKRGTWRR